MAKKANVLVTGAGGIIGQGIIKCLKMANEIKDTKIIYKIIGGDASALAAGLYLADKGIIIPKAEDERFIDSLIVAIRENSIKAVYVGTDRELNIVSRQREHIEDKTSAKIFTDSTKVVQIARDKWLTFRFLRENGFPCADSTLPSGLKDFLTDHKFPIVVKPREGFGSLHLYIVNDMTELLYAIKRIKKIGWKPIIQEFLYDDNEFTTGVLVDNSSKEIISSVSIKKSLKYGQTYRAFVDDFYDVRTLSEKVAMALGSSGAINIQSRNHKGINKIFEINPRFSATCIIRAHAGINEPDLLFRTEVLGERIRLKSYKKIICMRYWEELYIDNQRYENILKAQYSKIKRGLRESSSK